MVAGKSIRNELPNMPKLEILTETPYGDPLPGSVKNEKGSVKNEKGSVKIEKCSEKISMSHFFSKIFLVINAMSHQHYES